MANYPDKEPVKAFISGNSSEGYAQTGAWKNKHDKIVMSSGKFKIDTSTLDSDAEYTITVWVNDRKERDSQPDANIKLERIVPGTGGDSSSSSDDEDFDF